MLTTDVGVCVRCLRPAEGSTGCFTGGGSVVQLRRYWELMMFRVSGEEEEYVKLTGGALHSCGCRVYLVPLDDVL